MKVAKALVIIGHPAPSSFNHALAARVAEVWQASGLEVAVLDLAAIGFDPCLTPAEARGAPSADKQVQAHIAALLAADYLAIVHPVMWGMPPAILKGWIDRVFALGSAYGFATGTSEAEGAPAIGLLRLTRALVLCTSNAEPSQGGGDPLEQIWCDGIFRFCGVVQVDYRSFAPLVPNTDATRAGWLDEAGVLAAEALR
jgi:NAD(P)H dehydrogenase (quinone)